ncbi:hypothetical protein D918_09038 [Trichuris suis]|nr:hypothetical protein D918_09038 [Trichuris suis]
METLKRYTSASSEVEDVFTPSWVSIDVYGTMEEISSTSSSSSPALRCWRFKSIPKVLKNITTPEIIVCILSCLRWTFVHRRTYRLLDERPLIRVTDQQHRFEFTLDDLRKTLREGAVHLE